MIVAPSRRSLGQYDVQEEEVRTGSVTVWEVIVNRTMHRPTLPDDALESCTGEATATDIDGSLEDYLVEM